MNKVYDILLNIGKENPVFTGITLCQGDSGQTFNLHVTDFDTTDTTASIIFKKYDNNVVQATITAENGVYTYKMRGSELSTAGKVVADIKFYDSDNQRISSTSFVFEVVADTINATAVESSSQFDALVSASNRALAAAEAAEGAIMDIIPVATENILGGVKSGGDVTVNEDGTMSVDSVGDISEEEVTFTEAETDAELVPGSKLSSLIGLIKKKFNVVNNNLTTISNSLLAKIAFVSTVANSSNSIASILESIPQAQTVGFFAVAADTPDKPASLSIGTVVFFKNSSVSSGISLLFISKLTSNMKIKSGLYQSGVLTWEA